MQTANHAAMPQTEHSPSNHGLPHRPFIAIGNIVALVALVALLALLFSTTPLAAETSNLPESGNTFYGSNDQPLPLSEDQLLEFLRTAEITEARTLETGINHTQKLTLEQDGLSLHAVFRTVNKDVANTVRNSQTDRFVFRDSYKFEVAAYRLSRLLEIHRVPPAIFRTIDNQRGSVQLWIENAVTAADALKDGIALRQPTRRHFQRQLMYGFDLLVFNYDRHYGNILYDERDRMWFIDHTRAFKRLPQLRREQRPIISDQRFYQALSNLEPSVVKAHMKGALSKIETDALLRRRNLLLKHFDQLIAERGRDSVIVDMDRTHRPLAPTFIQLPTVSVEL